MDIQQIKYFLALAKELHFWKTAGKINITQSALSRHIQSLESELGIQLFERNKRNVKLTPAGKFLHDKWEVELNELNYIHHFAQQIHLGESGTIRIAYPDSISASILPQLILNIADTLPKLKIEMVQLPYDSQLDYLLNYKIDLLFSRDICTHKAISTNKIHTEALSIVVPEHHHGERMEDFSSKKLSDEKFILTQESGSSSYNEQIKQIFVHFNVVPDIYLHCELGSTILALVRKGLGISILPDSYQHHQVPGVKFIKLPFQTDLLLHWRTEDHNPVLSNVLKLTLNESFVTQIT